MKHNKKFLCAIVPILAMSLVVGCNKKNNQSSEKKPLEIGDTVKEWKSNKDLDEAPLGNADKDSYVEIVNDLGNKDKSSLRYDVYYASKTAYIGSDLLENPYFTEDDAKNGDIISLYVYLPSDSNVASLQLEVLPYSMNKGFKSELLTVGEDNVEQWIRLVASFDTLETLGAIHLNYKVVNASEYATFFVDDINITYGEETVATKYEYNDESLYRTYQDYFKVGACMSSTMFHNTELRKIVKNDFNSITAENEGKPEQVLDVEECRKLAKEDPTAVAITTAPFEKLYSWCEAHHIGVRHHTFVWYSQTPGWFFNEGYKDNGKKVNKEVMLGRMENFIKVSLETINNRWPGLVYAVDVANEAINQNQDSALRTDNNNWYSTVGKDFVYYAFKYARQYAAEGQKLYYNDFRYDYVTNNCKYALNTILKDAIAEELVDGVGIQGHIKDDQTPVNLMNDAKMIQQKGLECQITELDITTPGNGKSNFEKQKKLYHDLLKQILEGNLNGTTNVTAVVVWGITDNYSWRARDMEKYPLLYNEDYSKKPAYYGFLEAFYDVFPPEEEAE